MRIQDIEKPSQPFGEKWNPYVDTLDNSQNVAVKRLAKSMLNLLVRIEREIETDSVWYAFASHLDLCLNPFAKARDDGGRHVIAISPTTGLIADSSIPEDEQGAFLVEYRIPEETSLWPNSVVQMPTTSIKDCLRALQIAIHACT